MIKFNNDIWFERDGLNWKLHEFKDGVRKSTREPFRAKNTTYYSNIKDMCQSVLEKSCEGHDSIADLIAHFDSAVENLTEYAESLAQTEE